MNNLKLDFHIEKLNKSSTFKKTLLETINLVNYDSFYFEKMLFTISSFKEWVKFCAYGNEMKINKNGRYLLILKINLSRHLYPRINFDVQELNTSLNYSFGIEFCQIIKDSHRTEIVIKENYPKLIIKNKNGIKNGDWWMKNGISFENIKISNSPLRENYIYSDNSTTIVTEKLIILLYLGSSSTIQKICS